MMSSFVWYITFDQSAISTVIIVTRNGKPLQRHKVESYSYYLSYRRFTIYIYHYVPDNESVIGIFVSNITTQLGKLIKTLVSCIGHIMMELCSDKMVNRC